MARKPFKDEDVLDHFYWAGQDRKILIADITNWIGNGFLEISQHMSW